MSLSYNIARQKLRVCAERRKKYYDIQAKPQQFQVGDWAKPLPKAVQVKVNQVAEGLYRALFGSAYPAVQLLVVEVSEDQGICGSHRQLKKCHGEIPESWLSASLHK